MLKIKHKYIFWNSISNFMISLETVVSTDNMLTNLGIHNNSANLTYNYIGKDILGQLGSLIIINKIAKIIDDNPKKFIKYNMILEQSSNLIESLTPLLPINSFIYVAGSCNIFKNISFTGFGAINVKIINQLTENNNIGEVYSKLTILNTISSSLGMTCGLFLIKYVPCYNTRLCLLPLIGLIRYTTYNKAISYFNL